MAPFSRFRFKQPLLAAGLSLVFSGGPTLAQSEASVAVSALPVASILDGAAAVVGSAVAGSAAVVALPVALTVSGATLIVKAVEASARGTVWVLERTSDGARVSVELSGRAAAASNTVVGAAAVVSAVSTGVVLSAAGEVLCFIPNELGRALLYNQRVTP
jgi:hypothetical protein